MLWRTTGLLSLSRCAVSDSWEGMASNLRILDAYCELTGLRVQPSKCFGFLLKPTADSVTLNDCQAWSVGGQSLNMIGPDDTEVPGGKGGLLRGVLTPELQSQYEDWG